MPRPNFVIAGAARSGTTALAHSLAAHPEVFVTQPKEVHFLAHADAPTHYTGPGDDAFINRSLVTDPAEWEALFADATEPFRGEGSVSTLYHPERAIPALRAHADPGVKVITVLRSPAERAYSAYLYLRARGAETMPTFSAGLDAEAERIAAGWHHMWHYRAMSRYDEQLPAFADAFGPDLLVLDFDDVRRDSAAALAAVSEFLGLSTPLVESTTVNTGGEPRSRQLASAVEQIHRIPALANLLRTLLPPAARQAIRSRNLTRPEADPELLEQLRREFVPATEAVESVLGRPLPPWHPRT